MTTKELIREKIDSFYAEYKAKFHQNGEPYNLGIIDGLDMAERILDTLPDEPITTCNELEEAAENPYVLNDVSHAAFEYERTRNDLDARSDNEVVRRAFIAGAEWMKAKMMEGAVEGEVVKDISNKLAVTAKNINLDGLKFGDKVRIIILPKEDEK